MADRTCVKCNKTFRTPSHLRAHEARKTPCAPIIDAEDLPREVLEDPDLANKKCHFCGRVFSSYQAMRRHVRNTCQIAPNPRNGDAGIDLLYEHTLRKQMEAQQEQIKAQQNQIAELTGMMRQLIPAAGDGVVPAAGDKIVAPVMTNQIGNNNVAVVDNRVFNIRIFGQENTDHITSEQIQEILDQVTNMPLADGASRVVREATALVYSDPAHPENITCFLPNKKRREALVHEEEGWTARAEQDVKQRMASRGIDIAFAKQPFEGAEKYGPVMKELQVREGELSAKGEGISAILVRNKGLLQSTEDGLPREGAARGNQIKPA